MKTSTILSIVIIIFLIAYGLDTTRPPQQIKLPSQIAQAPVVDDVVAYVINSPTGSSTLVTTQDIEDGKYPIEGIEVSPNHFIIDRTKRFGSLWYFDTDHDGVIDPNDPIFTQLAFGYINPRTKIIRFVLMRNAGLRDIIIAPTALSNNNSAPNDWEEHSKVIMADGSHGLTYHVPVPTTFIDQLRTGPDSGQQLILPER